jgi:ABC-type transporter Mla MlaB component
VLRITRKGDAGCPSLRLEGRVEKDWVGVLRKEWEESLARFEGCKVTVDLMAVSFADPQGRALLLEMQKKGAALTKVSEFMRHILAERDDSD